VTRRIVTSQSQSLRLEAASVDGYWDRLVKYVPVEIVAAWVALIPLLETLNTAANWLVFSIMLVIAFVWILRLTGSSYTQAAISAVSFGVWAFALDSGPFAQIPREPAWGSVVLVLTTLVFALIVPKESA